MSAGRCGGAKIPFLHSGTVVKRIPGKLFDLLKLYYKGREKNTETAGGQKKGG
jgi:hypothetical protein